MVTTYQKQNSTSPEGNLSLKTGLIFRDYSIPKSKVDTSAHTYLNLGVRKSGFSPKGQQTSASQKLDRKRETKEILVSLLKKLGEKEIASKVQLCSSKFEVLHDGQTVIGRNTYHRCGNRLCPFCAARRRKKILNKYLPRTRDFVKRSGSPVTPCHLVLTQSHKKGETIGQARKRLMDSFRKLVDRKFFKTYFAGGIFAFETTVGRDGLNHFHAHCIVFRRRFFDVSVLRAEWQKVTGDSVNLKLDRITGLESGLREIIKYVSKIQDIGKFGANHIRQLLELRGKKMFGTFGEFAKFCATYEGDESDNDFDGDGEKSTLQAGDVCPCGCGRKLVREVMTDRQLISFMRRREVVPRK